MQSEQRAQADTASQPSFFLDICKVFDSLFKANKKPTREFIFNSLIAINLKLHSSKEAYLNTLMDTISNALEADWFLVLVKNGEYLNLLLWDLEGSGVMNRSTNDPELLLAFVQITPGIGQAEALRLSQKFARVLLNDIELEFVFSNAWAYPVKRTLQLSKDTSTEIIGILFCQKPSIDSQASIWNLLFH